MAGVYYDAGIIRTGFVMEFFLKAAFRDVPAFRSQSLGMPKSQA
jgi:hypothetical protein